MLGNEKGVGEMNNGIHFDINREQYDAIRRVNWSSLKVMDRSAAHFRHSQLVGQEDTDARKMGRVTHLATFEPETFAATCVVWDGGIRRGKDWDKFKAKHEGREILTESEHAQCVAIAAAVRADAPAAKYLAGGKAEATVLWTHTVKPVGDLPGYSIDCKARIDFAADVGALVDLKTTRDARPEKFRDQAWRLLYHAQAAIYQDAYFAVTGRRLPYVLVAVESEAPHLVTVRPVGSVLLERGREKYRELMDKLAVCRAENRWEGYAVGEMELDTPPWAEPKDEEDSTGLGLVFGEEEAWTTS